VYPNDPNYQHPRSQDALVTTVATGGDGDEIIISRANKPIARLVAYHEKASQRRLGEAKGMVEIMPDFDTLPDDFMAHFE
jgi:antitoxin (DNA-binding transcriptional repressor) of toxin-antitoxin stability system